MRTIVTILALLLIFVTTLLLGLIKPWIGLICGIVLILWFIYSSIRIVPADPPTKGVLVFLGERQNKVLSEGWHFLPLFPIVFNMILVKVVKINQDLPEQITRTPDYAELGVSVSITWTPGASPKEYSEEDQGETLINFLNSGEEKRVKDIIDDIIRDRLRAWAFSSGEGPSNWQEAMGARDEAVAILVKAILGDDLSPIPSPIPTPVLLKYFNEPPKPPSEYEKGRWGKQTKNGDEWEGLRGELAGLAADQLAELEGSVKERIKAIKTVRQGNGMFRKKSLGITINRFTINDIILKGKLAEAVDLAVKEKHERDADIIEINNVLKRVQELRKKLNITTEQALEIVQTERKKVTKNVNEGKLNISPETREMLERVLPKLIEKLVK